MTATSFKIEPALRRAARAAIFQSASLTEGFRSAKRARRPSIWKIFYHTVLILLAGPMMAIGIPLIVIMGIEQQAGPDGLLAFIAALSTCISLAGAQFFVSRLRQSKHISVLSHLPVPDARIADEEWREIAAWSSALLYPVALALGYLAWKNGFGFGGWALTALLAAFHWLTCLATGTTLAIFLPRFPFAAVCSLIAVAGVLWIQAGAPQLAAMIFGLYVLVPAGWVNAVLGLALLKQVAEAWFAAAAAILWIAVTVLALKRLAQKYACVNLSFPPDTNASALLAPPFDKRRNMIARIWGFVFPWWPNRRAVDDGELSDAVAEERIKTGEFLQPAARLRSQWIERLVDCWLTDRERVVLELLTANRSRWSQWWWTLAICGAFFSLIAVAGGAPIPLNFAAGCIPAVYFSFYFLFTGPWPGLRTKECAGTFVARYSVFPVGWDEVSRVLLKVGLVRCLVVFVPVILVAASSIGPQNIGLQLAIPIVVGYAAALVAAQGWVIGLFLSAAMRFPDLRLRTLGWHMLPALPLLASLFLGMPMLVVGIKQQIPRAELLIVGGILILALSPWANWRVLRAMYHRGLIDLVRNSRSSVDELISKYDALEHKRMLSEERVRRYGWFWWLA